MFLVPPFLSLKADILRQSGRTSSAINSTIACVSRIQGPLHICTRASSECVSQVALWLTSSLQQRVQSLSCALEESQSREAAAAEKLHMCERQLQEQAADFRDDSLFLQKHMKGELRESEQDHNEVSIPIPSYWVSRAGCCHLLTCSVSTDLAYCTCGLGCGGTYVHRTCHVAEVVLGYYLIIFR